LIKSKAIELIKTFSRDEMDDFDLFCRSPYFNSNKNIIKLYSQLKPSFGKFDSADLTEEFLYKKIFPGKDYNYGIMKNLMSDLNKLVEKFLIVNSSKVSEDYRFEGLMNLANIYDERGLDSSFKKMILGLKENLDNELIGINRYRMYAGLEQSIYFFYANRSDDKGLQEAVYNEMIYTLCEFFRKSSRNLWKIDISRGNMNTQYEKDFAEVFRKNINFEGIEESLKGIRKLDYENLIMNRMLINLVTEPEKKEVFYEIKEYLNSNIDKYTNSERFSIITKVLSYCAGAFNNGHKEFLKESVELKKLMMKKVKFKEDGLGPFNYSMFNQTVREFLHLGDTKGAEHFANNYLHWLDDDKKDYALHLSMASIEEAKQNYEKAIEHLTCIKKIDFPTKLVVRYVYLRLYYSMDHFESGFSLIASFRNLIPKSDEMDQSSKIHNLDTLKVFEKLYKIKCTPEKYSLYDVEKLINLINTKFLIGAPWLLQKAGELKKIIR
jgi:hypothetical protein